MLILDTLDEAPTRLASADGTAFMTLDDQVESLQDEVIQDLQAAVALLARSTAAVSGGDYEHASRVVEAARAILERRAQPAIGLLRILD